MIYYSNSFVNRRHRLGIQMQYFRRQNSFICFFFSLATAFAQSCSVLRSVHFLQSQSQRL